MGTKGGDGSRRWVDYQGYGTPSEHGNREGRPRSLLGKSVTRGECGGHEAGMWCENEEEMTGESFLRNESVREEK